MVAVHPALVHPRYAAGVLLGQGAQGVAVRVQDREQPHRALVAKVLAAGQCTEASLEGEFALLARTYVPGLVRAHDFGRDERTGAPFLVEDFVDGPDAASWVRDAPSDAARVERLVTILSSVAQTLCFLHDAGFVHGDLKPDHVRIHGGERPTLLDLGAAVRWSRRSTDAARAFTRGYAAPELLAGSAPSPRTDLYALGALVHAVVVGAPPTEAGLQLHRKARWVPAALAELVDTLVAAHPEDRPKDARDVLAGLSAACPAEQRPAVAGARSLGGVIRQDSLAQLSRPQLGVRYVTGAPGAGKSHLLDELVIRALLSGRPVRRVRFPSVDAAMSLRLLAWLRGRQDACPFTLPAQGVALVVLDDVEQGPAELPAALEAFRCHGATELNLDVIVGVRQAPEAAEPHMLAPLQREACERLCSEIDPTQDAAAIWLASQGNIGWIVAALGSVPLSREAIVERARSLSPPARMQLGMLAAAGGHLSEACLIRAVNESASEALAELARHALIHRHVRGVAREREVFLVGAERAEELADALAPHDVVDRLASAVLEPGMHVSVPALLALARAPHAPSERNALLRLAAERSRLDGLRGEQVEALLELCADPSQRSAQVLAELDRITRGGGSAGMHPRLVDWLEEGARRFPALAVLSLRRRAELCARTGEVELARSTAARALSLAEESRDPVGVALAYSTGGAVALYRADWEFAERALEQARRTIAAGAVDDAEEIARIHHNFGVVALYRGRLEAAAAAFTQSLDAKRALGDRAGVWACLLNLGLARSQLGELDAAEDALTEATALCRSLSQLAGVGWCLAAQAEVALRRGNTRTAEKCISDAEHLGETLPVPVRADLLLLRSELALLEGDARRGLSELARLPADTRTGDPAVDLRACVLEARAALVQLPADRKRASKLAVSVIRRARKLELAEPERRAWVLLREVRRGRKTTGKPGGSEVRYDADVGVDAIFEWLDGVARGTSAEDAGVALAQLLCRGSGAERAFLILLDDGDRVVRAVGVDLDGLPVAEPEKRAGPAITDVHGVSHVPIVDTPGGRGRRLSATLVGPGGPAGVLLGHRFLTGCFERVSEELAARWLSLAALCMRLGRDEAEASVSPRPPVLAMPAASVTLREVTAEPSTVLPLRQRQRQYPALVGTSAAFQRALDRLDAAVDSELPVLISGETGVGKELFARALHDAGPRKSAHFVAINCGAIPDALFEAELFGHARGSFTGADRARQGLLARAEGGTLFLDEIGELPLLRQAALLRALATRTYRPVGSDSERPFDVRIVAATNRNLEQEVENGRFRRDLLYRIQVLHVAVPPLREREGDVLEIAKHVMRHAGRELPITKEAAEVLVAYRWPGNVRELEHQIQRIAAAGTDAVSVEHLSREVRGATRRKQKPRAAAGSSDERQEVEQALRSADGNITRAARTLSMTRQGLKKKMARLGMRNSADVRAGAVRATPSGQK